MKSFGRFLLNVGAGGVFLIILLIGFTAPMKLYTEQTFLFALKVAGVLAITALVGVAAIRASDD